MGFLKINWWCCSYHSDHKDASHFVGKVSSSNEGEPCDDISLWTSKCDLAWKDLTIDSTSLIGKGCFTEVRMGSVKIAGKITQAAIKTIRGKLTQPTSLCFISLANCCFSLEGGDTAYCPWKRGWCKLTTPCRIPCIHFLCNSIQIFICFS